MAPKQVLPIQIKVHLRVMVMNWYFTFPSSPLFFFFFFTPLQMYGLLYSAGPANKVDSITSHAVSSMQLLTTTSEKMCTSFINRDNTITLP